jgi:hypothetical protein
MPKMSVSWEERSRSPIGVSCEGKWMNDVGVSLGMGTFRAAQRCYDLDRSKGVGTGWSLGCRDSVRRLQLEEMLHSVTFVVDSVHDFRRQLGDDNCSDFGRKGSKVTLLHDGSCLGMLLTEPLPYSLEGGSSNRDLQNAIEL